jgi:ornithine cyclodeaminase
MRIISLEEIKKVLSSLDIISSMEAGFVAYSQKKTVIPPVGELILERGEVHIKYGYLKEDPYYVIKIASGFYDNAEFGLPSSNGLMLLFSQKTGELVSILLDEGYLTDVRTAAAGAVAAKHLAPRNTKRIGIVGTGIQARLQLSYLSNVSECKQVLVWGRGRSQLEMYKTEMQKQGFLIETTLDTSDILRTCNLVVTTTPSRTPLISSSDLQPGTHITAVGSDTPDKQELDSAILKRADIVVADSISQCLLRGEIYKAVQSNQISGDDLVELGDIIAGARTGRTHDNQITVSDLTGVAVQDIQITEAVYKAIVLKE